MQISADLDGPRHAGARAVVLALVEDVLTDDQIELLDASLSEISAELLHGVVHDGLSERAALHGAHTAAELAAIREMLPVGTGSTRNRGGGRRSE